MPYYEFECENEKCPERVFTIKYSYSEPHLTSCPSCGYGVRQIFSPIPAIYKGSGFFSTDNKESNQARGESGVMGRRVSQTDASNIDEATPTLVGEKGRPKMTPTRPLPPRIRQELKARDMEDVKLEGGITRRTHIF